MPVYAPKSTWEVVSWWESRRALYNITVGAAGLLSLVTVALSAWIHPHPVPFRPPFVAILAYAVMANLFYTLGPVVDSFIHHRFGPEYAVVGPTIFRYGFVFSVGLTLLPIPVAAMLWIARLILA